MTQGRRSLQRRLVFVQALSTALVFLFVGLLLLKLMEASHIERDHGLLRRQAQLLQQLAAFDAARADANTLQQHLDTLRFTQPALQVLRGEQAASTGLGFDARQQDASEFSVRVVVLDGAPAEVVDMEIRHHSGVMEPLRLVLPTQARQATVRQLRDTLLGIAAAGVLMSIALSVLGLRWGLRSLRHLSWEGSRLASGGRISTTPVDAELVGLVLAFNATLDKLEQAYRQSEAFSADVAHELRSPLATLIVGTQFMLRAPRTAIELRDALVSNLEELEKLKTLVNDMLFLARADQGERAQSLVRVDLGALADATIDYCSALLDEAGLTVQRHGTASAVCNAALILRAMANLLSNAIQHASGGRRLELHIEAAPGKVRMWVFNTGEPLTSGVASRMFDRFFRASEARSEHGERHGLGLAIVQAVARMHGGGVFVSPQTDGNSIGFYIPSAMAVGQRRLREPEPGPL